MNEPTWAFEYVVKKFHIERQLAFEAFLISEGSRIKTLRFLQRNGIEGLSLDDVRADIDGSIDLSVPDGELTWTKNIN